jgi:hypothetical protein
MFICPYFRVRVCIHGHGHGHGHMDMNTWTYRHLDIWIEGHNREGQYVVVEVGEFCHYTFCLFRPFALIRLVVVCFVFLYILSLYVLS